MESIKIHVASADTCVVSAPVITAGMVGLPVEFSFDSAWNGITKTAVFTAGGVTRIRPAITGTVTVPHEILQKSGVMLQIGVYGTDTAENVVIPGVMADVDHIQVGADPNGDEGVEPENPVWKQMLSRMERTETGLQSATTAAKTAADQAVQAAVRALVAAENCDKTANKVHQVLPIISQGRSAKYSVTSPGWKRVLNIIRSTSGTLTVGLAKEQGDGMSCQALGVNLTGYVSFPGKGLPGKEPVLYQLYNNVFGENDVVDESCRARITQVRVGYPTADTAFPDTHGAIDYTPNPVNCYVDVYVDIPQEHRAQLQINFAGFADSHNCQAITEETDAKDVGMYGEELEYHTLTLKKDATLYLPNGRIEAKEATFGNMPFARIDGTQENPFVLADLSDGIYYLTGYGKFYQGHPAEIRATGIYMVRKYSDYSSICVIQHTAAHNIRWYKIQGQTVTIKTVDMDYVYAGGDLDLKNSSLLQAGLVNLVNGGGDHVDIHTVDTDRDADGDRVAVAQLTGEAYTNKNAVLLRNIAPGSKEHDAVTKGQLDATVDRLCPEFTQSGSVVTCQPVEGYPLSAVSHIEPVQAGSGDPYPPGGGKNLIPYPYKNTTKTEKGITYTDNGDGSITINGTATADSYFILCTIDFGGSWAGGTHNSFTANGYTYSLKNAVAGKVVLTYEGASTKNTFVKVISGSTLSNLTVYPQVELGTTATDYAPYSNIRPITGHEGVRLVCGGRNHIDVSEDDVFSGYWYDSSGTASGENASFIRVAHQSVMPNTRYTISCNLLINTIWFWDSTTGGIEKKNIGATYNTFTTPGNCDGIRISLRNTSGAADTSAFAWIQLELGSAKTPYEPYKVSPRAFTLDLGQTVYGGSLDWKTGVLTVDTYNITIDGTESVEQNTIGGYPRFDITPGIAIPVQSSYQSDQLCSHFMLNSGAAIVGNTRDLSFAAFKGKIYIRYDAMVEVAAFKAFLAQQYAAGTPVQVCYKLATPLTVQLTPREVVALSGSNTLYSDTGDTTVTGKADPVAIINNLQTRLAAIEAAIVSNT